RRTAVYLSITASFAQLLQVIPVVIINFTRRAHWQRAATEMENHAFRTIADAPAGVPKTPTKIYFLHMEFKVLIKAMLFYKQLFTNSQGSTAGPKNIFGIIILSKILLYGIKDSSAAKWIAKTI